MLKVFCNFCYTIYIIILCDYFFGIPFWHFFQVSTLVTILANQYMFLPATIFIISIVYFSNPPLKTNQKIVLVFFRFILKTIMLIVPFKKELIIIAMDQSEMVLLQVYTFPKLAKYSQDSHYKTSSFQPGFLESWIRWG